MALRSTGPGTARSRSAWPAVLVVLIGACSAAQPTSASLASEPVLQPLPGEVELADVRVQPRRGRIGVPGRDGVVERVVALGLTPSAAADLVQQRHAGRYAFRRVDLGRGSAGAVTVELRGTSPTGATVVVTSSSTPPVPLYGGPDEVQPAPPDRVTSVVITVVSPQ